MFSRIRSHMSFANTVSLLALFVALSGTAYAAVKLPKNSVGARQIKKNGVGASEIKRNAVGTSEVKNGSLGLSDFNAADAPQDGATGPRGPAGADGADGADGAPGAPGTARAFARVRGDGVLEGGATQSKGITQAMIQKNGGASTAETTGPGVYCFGNLGFTPTSVTVTTDNTDAMPTVGVNTGGSLNFISTAAIFKGEDFNRCDNAHGQARVAIQRVDQNNAPELVDHGFFVWFEG